MKYAILNKRKFGELKIFLFTSLGIHILLFCLLTLFVSDIKIKPPFPLHIEVSLFPLVTEAPILTKRIPSQVIEDQILSPPKIAKNISPEEPEILTTESRKQEIEEEKEKKVEKEIISPKVTMIRSSESSVNNKTEVLYPNQREQSFYLNKEESFHSSPSHFEPASTNPPSNQDKLLEEKKEDSLASYHLESPRLQTKDKPHFKLKDEEESSRLIEQKITIFSQPKYIENPKPIYPKEARKKGYEGEVLLRVEVLVNGRVGRLEVKKSSGFEILDRSALTAVKNWKFIPANQGNGPIPCWVNIPIKFKLQ